MILINWIKLQSSGCEPRMCVYETGGRKRQGKKNSPKHLHMARQSALLLNEHRSLRRPVWGQGREGVGESLLAHQGRTDADVGMDASD